MVSQLKIVETVFNKLKNFPATVIFMNQNILTPAVPAFYFMNKKMVNALGQWQVHLHSKNEISLIKKTFKYCSIFFLN